MTKTSTLLSDTEILRRLVGFDSTSENSNLPIADFICDYLDRPGVRVEKTPGPRDDKTNVVVTVGPQTDPVTRRGLVLSGHLDTVPAGEPEWQSDPFELFETDERFYGRGAVDMKGFVALAVNLAARAAGEKLDAPLVLVLTCDEEIGTVGARCFAESWPAERPLPRATVVGEPTSRQAVRMHKGLLGQEIVFTGQSAHSGYPHLGRSAIEPAARAVCALADLRRELEREPGPNGEYFAEIPFVALNVGRLTGGAAVNVIPDRCVVEICFRVLPGMDAASIAERVGAAVERAAAGDPYTIATVQEAPALLLAAESEIYQAVSKLVGQKETVSVSYATDAGWLQKAGLDCVIFGPGSIEPAHKPNEWMPKDEFYQGASDLESLLGRFCAVG